MKKISILFLFIFLITLTSCNPFTKNIIIDDSSTEVIQSDITAAIDKAKTFTVRVHNDTQSIYYSGLIYSKEDLNDSSTYSVVIYSNIDLSKDSFSIYYDIDNKVAVDNSTVKFSLNYSILVMKFTLKNSLYVFSYYNLDEITNEVKQGNFIISMNLTDPNYYCLTYISNVIYKDEKKFFSDLKPTQTNLGVVINIAGKFVGFETSLNNTYVESILKSNVYTGIKEIEATQ